MSLWSQAFTLAGPSRLRYIQPEDFARKMALKDNFGSMPPQTEERGGRVNYNSLAYRYWAAYQMLERDFDGILRDNFLTHVQFERVIESTGGRVIFWKSKSGTSYMALLDVLFIEEPIYRFPVDIFSDPNRGDAVNDVWMTILRRGGIIAFPPDIPGSASGWDNVSSVVRELNDRNIKALQEAGLLPK
jgi:hypothetical protein